MNERPLYQKIQYWPSSLGSLESQSSHIGMAVTKACSFQCECWIPQEHHKGKIITFFRMFISFLKTPSDSSLFRGCIQVKMSTLFSKENLLYSEKKFLFSHVTLNQDGRGGKLSSSLYHALF